MVELIKPWNEYPEIWKTESAFMSWIRGGIRRGLWERSPIKLQFLAKNRVRISNGTFKGTGGEKTCWGAKCALCQETFKLKDIEVDHKLGGHSLRSLEDLYNFITNIVLVTEDDLQLVCKPCHKAKNHSERMGVSFEEAVAEKAVIAICKEGTAAQKDWLQSRGCAPSSNAKSRREQIKEILLGETSAK